MTGLSDKEMAVIFKKDAGDYMIAAENLRTDEHSIYLVAPTYFLRGHAIELLLKACLLANGWTLDACRKKLGHKLLVGLTEAENVGLVLSDQTKSVIATLSPRHEDYTFRYRPDKPYAFPNQKAATDAIAELFDKVHAIVVDKVLNERKP
ncbi:hypothetical protein JQ616_37945 [Bradyrhizobium tropiciagri]|uniref:hypothetical protein n=1 Tax=Bradyrhizobium tropiciagri TaxID=312253 RepID=UPI001BAD9505|nr:hypothetical protein [Bradyrhizobium tropiciagri]MBR0900770.1 hypothetical protein [Bradyrhizobium tropiciagri]